MEKDNKRPTLIKIDSKLWRNGKKKSIDSGLTFSEYIENLIKWDLLK